MLKCEFCQRRSDCKLKDLVVLTLPWVVEAQQAEENDWERLHKIKRALRNGGGTSGFTDDWICVGAMTQQDVAELAEKIVRNSEVTLADLCAYCRHYLGPAIDLSDTWQTLQDGR